MAAGIPEPTFVIDEVEIDDQVKGIEVDDSLSPTIDNVTIRRSGNPGLQTESGFTATNIRFEDQVTGNEIFTKSPCDGVNITAQEITSGSDSNPGNWYDTGTNNSVTWGTCPGRTAAAQTYDVPLEATDEVTFCTAVLTVLTAD